MHASRRVASALLLGGVLAPPVFVAVFLVEGATRAGYDPVRLPISLLARGDGGWVQTANFLVMGALTLGFAAGFREATALLGRPTRLGPALIGMFAVGLLGAGIFPADPGGGYPPGVRSVGTTNGTLHDIASLVVFTSLPAACLAVGGWFARAGRRRSAAWSVVAAVALSVGFVAILVAFNGRGDLSRVGGLIQRLTVGVGWTWLAVLAASTRRQLADAPAAARAS